jgi:hypothetical protein
VDQLEATDEDDESDKHDEEDEDNDEADGVASNEDGDNKNRAGAITKSLCYSQFADNNESFSLLPSVLFFSKDTLVDVISQHHSSTSSYKFLITYLVQHPPSRILKLQHDPFHNDGVEDRETVSILD